MNEVKDAALTLAYIVNEYFDGEKPGTDLEAQWEHVCSMLRVLENELFRIADEKEEE